jgi:hypothetical protein
MLFSITVLRMSRSSSSLEVCRPTFCIPYGVHFLPVSSLLIKPSGLYLGVVRIMVRIPLCFQACLPVFATNLTSSDSKLADCGLGLIPIWDRGCSVQIHCQIGFGVHPVQCVVFTECSLP